MPQRQKTLFGGATRREIHKPITTGNVASDAAAERVRVRATGQAAQIYAPIRAAGTAGMTDAELEAATGIPGNSVRPRRLRLQELGYIRLLLGPDLKPILRDDHSIYVVTAKAWPHDPLPEVIPGKQAPYQGDR